MLKYNFQIKLFWNFCLCSPVQVLVSGQSPASADDIYLDDQQSGDYPLDDDDFTSGSGSGKDCFWFYNSLLYYYCCSEASSVSRDHNYNIMTITQQTPNTKCSILAHNSSHTACEW